MSLDFLILKSPIVGDGAGAPIGTLAEVSERVERALGIAIAESGTIAGRDWELSYDASPEDGVVTLIYLAMRSSCASRRPQFLGSYDDALRSIAAALDAVAVDAQNGVPLGSDRDDVPAPEQADGFVIELAAAAGPNHDLGRASEIWRDLEQRFGMTPEHCSMTGDGWSLRVVGATEGALRRLVLHLSWANATARTTLLKRCATINDGDWVALDPARGGVLPLDWFLE